MVIRQSSISLKHLRTVSNFPPAIVYGNQNQSYHSPRKTITYRETLADPLSIAEHALPSSRSLTKPSGTHRTLPGQSAEHKRPKMDAMLYTLLLLREMRRAPEKKTNDTCPALPRRAIICRIDYLPATSSVAGYVLAQCF